MEYKDLLLEYCNSDPAIGLQDVFKYLYQSCFGCEHLVRESPMLLERITEELKTAQEDDLPDVEMLDGEYCRVHLKALIHDGSEETCQKIAELFVKSSKNEPDGRKRLKEKLERLFILARNGQIPFSEDQVREAVARWKERDFCPVHHSGNYRDAHHPAYRVIAKDLVNELNLK